MRALRHRESDLGNDEKGSEREGEMFISLSPSLFLVSLFEHRFLLHSVVYYPLIVRAPRTGFLRNPARSENLASGKIRKTPFPTS